MLPAAIWSARSSRTISVALRYRRDRSAVIAAASLVASLLALTVVFLAWQSRERALHTAEQEARNLSLALSELVARSAESVDLLLRSLRETVLTGDLADDTFCRRLSELAAERILGIPPVRAMVIIDAKGQIVALSRGHPPPKVNVADRDYFIASRDQPPDRDQLFVGSPTINRINQEWTINVARRVSDREGRFRGVVLLTLEPLYYERVFGTINLTPGGTIAMFRSDGVLLARHPHDEGRLGQPIGDTPFRRVLLQQPNQAAVTRARGGIDNEMRVIAGRFLKDVPVYVTVSQPEHVVLAPWRSDLLTTSAMVGLVVLALAALTALLLHQMNRREAAEKAIVEARQEAERANRAKSAFLANMSHELRTPLNAIVGFAEVLDQQMFGPIANPKQREYIRDIRRSGEHLRDLVSDILDLAKVEAEKWVLRPDAVDLPMEMQQVVAIMRGLAEGKGLELVFEPAATPASVMADPLVLRQMLINLVGNAIKFTPQGGRIVLAAKADDRACVISVADNGVGIRPEDIERVLEPFEQGDSNLPRPVKDSGLGLALTKAFAELHGGRLEIRSEVGIGTDIRLILPTAAEPRQTAAA